MKRFILVLDDDLKILNIIKKALTTNNHKVFAYSDPVDALEYYREGHMEYDLIITDIQMPRMTGHEFIDEVKKITPEIKTLGMSGSRDIDLKKNIFDNFIDKPFEVKQLRDTVTKTFPQK